MEITIHLALSIMSVVSYSTAITLTVEVLGRSDGRVVRVGDFLLRCISDPYSERTLSEYEGLVGREDNRAAGLRVLRVHSLNTSDQFFLAAG